MLEESQDVLVKTANRLYHQLEAEIYDHVHREITVGEVPNWEAICRIILHKLGRRRLLVLDIGTGTGFVPQMLESCISDSIVICTDMAREMLLRAREKLAASAGNRCLFVCCDADALPFPRSVQFDLVTLNSTLHHLPEPLKSVSALAILLREGGLLVIGHEPNQRFYRNPWLRCLSKLRSFARALRISKRSRTTPLLTSTGRIKAKVIEAMIRQGIPVQSESELARLIDVHSPTAGGRVDVARGFDVRQFQKQLAPNFHLELVKTYNYLGKKSVNHPSAKLLDILNQRLFPLDGALFYAIFSKQRYS